MLLSNVEDINPLESIKNIAYITFYGTDRTIHPKKFEHATNVPSYICRRVFMAKSLKIRPLVLSEQGVFGTDTKSQGSEQPEPPEQEKGNYDND